jgi:hypothetical protein
MAREGLDRGSFGSENTFSLYDYYCKQDWELAAGGGIDAKHYP